MDGGYGLIPGGRWLAVQGWRPVEELIRAAHEAGVRRLAMEALSWPAKDTPGPILAVPSDRAKLRGGSR